MHTTQQQNTQKQTTITVYTTAGTPRAAAPLSHIRRLAGCAISIPQGAQATEWLLSFWADFLRDTELQKYIPHIFLFVCLFDG